MECATFTDSNSTEGQPQNRHPAATILHRCRATRADTAH